MAIDDTGRIVMSTHDDKNDRKQDRSTLETTFLVLRKRERHMATVITQDDLIESVAAALQYISYL